MYKQHYRMYDKKYRSEKRKADKDKPKLSHAFLEDPSKRVKFVKNKIEHEIIAEEPPRKKKQSKKKKSKRKVEEITFVELAVPTKSESDKKTYKMIKLNNGLKCCLISDDEAIHEEWQDISESDLEDDDDDDGHVYTTDDLVESDAVPDNRTTSLEGNETKMAAVALCVGVGSFYDPLDVPGMAHFLEHMVFMGSKKYPKENDFDAFIKKSGGSDNASTDCEMTTFHLEIFEKYLPKALDRFSQFFIAPLCKRDSMLKEREAIDSEFAQAKNKDAYRSEQLFFNMFKDSAKVCKFSWGNMQTLLYTDMTDEDLYDKLHQFRKKYYVASRMTLAIQARLPMSVLEEYVVQFFSKVPMGNPDEREPRFKSMGPNIFDKKLFNKIYYVKPIKNIYLLILSWNMPSQKIHYQEKAHEYFASLLGHESKGSLLSYLKKKVWALSIEAGTDDNSSAHNSVYCLFQVKIVLTEDGLDNLFNITNAVYGYINMIKANTPSKSHFQELQQITQTSFNYQHEVSAEENVIEIAENMQIYPPAEVLTGPVLFSRYSEKHIQSFLDDLNPYNMNIMIFSSLLPPNITFDQQDPWFHIKYGVRPIPSKICQVWLEQEQLEEFSMPSPNIFITKDFNLLTHRHSSSNAAPKKIMLKEIFCELWYLLNTKFKLPYAYYNIHLVNVKFMETPDNACMSDLLVRLLNLLMSEETYPAELAQLNYVFTTSELGFIIKLGGFNEKLQDLLYIIAYYMKNVRRLLTEKLFHVVKQKQLLHYQSQFMKSAQLARDLRLKILLGKHYTSVQKHEVTNSIFYQRFKEFVTNIFDHVFVQMLIEGNVSEADAFNVAFNFHRELKYEHILRAPYLIIKDNISESELGKVTALCKKLTKKYKCEFKIVESTTEEAVRADKSTPPLNMQVYQLPLGEHCARTHSLNAEDSNSVVTNYYQIGPYSPRTSVALELLMMIINEPLFDTLRTKNGLGYEVYCTFRDTYNILGYSITVVSQEHKHATAKVEECIEMFRSEVTALLRKMSQKKFKAYVSDLLKVKKVADTNLGQQVERHWEEIMSQNLNFRRNETEIIALEELRLNYLKKFWDINNSVKQNFRKLTIQVIGKVKRVEEDVRSSKPICTPRNMKKNSFLTGNQIESMNVDHNNIDLIGSKEETWAENKQEGYFIRNIEIFVSMLSYFVANVQMNHK